MNQVKLVEMLKNATKEKLLSEVIQRYGRQINKRASNLKSRYKEGYKNPQLAEEEDDVDQKVKEKTGKTDTGKPANKIITEPQYQSQMSPTQGPKPSIDTK